MNFRILSNYRKRKNIKFRMIEGTHTANCKGKFIANTSYKGVALTIIKCGDWYFLREPNQIKMEN